VDRCELATVIRDHRASTSLLKIRAHEAVATRVTGMGPEVVEGGLPAEQRARVLIDRQLADAGWLVQDRKDLNLFAGPGVAVREVVMKPGHGRADYLLYIDRQAVGVIEAKPQGTEVCLSKCRA